MSGHIIRGLFIGRKARHITAYLQQLYQAASRIVRVIKTPSDTVVIVDDSVVVTGKVVCSAVFVPLVKVGESRPPLNPDASKLTAGRWPQVFREDTAVSQCITAKAYVVVVVGNSLNNFPQGLNLAAGTSHCFSALWASCLLHRHPTFANCERVAIYTRVPMANSRELTSHGRVYGTRFISRHGVVTG